ncbi:hypothetical protein CB0940_09453 [Cercospora beticola]|uniref:DUF4267 domain-containing protein n=1 Tax=Cercospora beticola TaxID=122368 RepID=A0A2G5HH77_CERBT|nr:hypothetical protein CB0940_09453 [Cercospora beticola]PIA91583.1 hypothetical protein CB0940_09453 [Cercospora beticola]WPB06232.1 hypothetical protein RHO25_010889 [Cercospora beticola]
MTFPNHLLSRSTWRNLGLGTAYLILGLGTWPMIAPLSAAQSLGVVGLTTEEGEAMAIKGMRFLGIRDIAVAASLLWFHHESNQRAMGAILTAWILVCVTDTWIAAQGPRGFDGGVLGLCGGAVAIAFVGLGLAQY